LRDLKIEKLTKQLHEATTRNPKREQLENLKKSFQHLQEDYEKCKHEYIELKEDIKLKEKEKFEIE